MTVKPLLYEFGMGSSLRRGDYTEAALRAVKDALWRNSINLAELFDFPKEAMRITVQVAVAEPDAVDRAAIGAVFPYGMVSVEVTRGGLDVPRPEGQPGSGTPTIIAHAAIAVGFEMERAS